MKKIKGAQLQHQLALSHLRGPSYPDAPNLLEIVRGS